MPVHHWRIESGHTWVFGQQIIQDPLNTPLGPEFPATAGGTEGIALATKQHSALCLCITGGLNPATHRFSANRSSETTHVARLVCRRCAPSPSPGSAEMRRVSRRSGVFRGARSLDRSGGGPNVFRSGQGCGNGRLPGVPLRLLAVRHSNRGSHGNSRGNELHAISHNARQPNQTGINVL